MKMTRRYLGTGAIIILIILGVGCSAAAQPVAFPRIELGLTPATEPQEVALGLQLLFMLTVLSLVPAILVLTTSFTRVVVVLSFVRSGLSTQQVPPNQVILGLALFLTFFIMAPYWSQVNEQALQPYLSGQLSSQEALQIGTQPIRTFMFQETREKDLALFIGLADLPRPDVRDDVPTHVLIPAFVISELKTAFEIGFLIYIPFLIIDMVVASTLMSMGMLMLPPVMISLPFKLLLFVMVDGWHLVVRALLESF
ncbi:MAG: flagellar type III secretion system pore protein FliP [bacterium]|jgi:flagellar biosynthetic protein FliP